jgi:type II secretory pathway pseudopilin PulG
MVVIVIIGVLVTLAIPSIAQQMRDRRNNQAAHEVALLYRRARALAMGRGAAVMIRYDAATRGMVEVREARNTTPAKAGVSGTCSTLPATNCQGTVWTDGDPSNQLVATFDPAQQGAYPNAQIDFFKADGSKQTAVDLCFTPSGRPLVRYGHTGQFSPLPEVPYIEVSPVDKGGITRTVLVSPSGASRLAL